MKKLVKSVVPAAFVLLIAAPFSQSFAKIDNTVSKLSVKTSVQDVNGVREIEAGNYAAGIRKSEAALAKVTVNHLRKPLLDNLCVAHLALENKEKASLYCNKAVDTGQPSAISFNNRAVMHYMNGDIEASLVDLEQAQALGSFSKLVKANINLLEKYNMLSSN